ncbi:MAG: HAMP domain-containing histidine kinase [Acidobacteria bacterium]|nr:HAMP domain-containing histidine kinase [Acidobacteriota bacterium]
MEVVAGGQTASRTRNGVVAVLAGFAVIAILLALAFIFSAASNASRVAANATALHETNAAVGSTALSRAAIAQAVVFGIDYTIHETATRSARDEAVAAAEANLDESEVWAEVLAQDPETEELAAELSAYIAAGRSVVEAVARGQIREADIELQSVLEPQYVSVADGLAARQDVMASRVNDTERVAGLVGLVTQLLTTLLIPAATILIYFFIVRRQYREEHVRMQTKLTAERELSVSKDDFIAGLSHELRTPLTSIYGFSEYLLETGLSDPVEALELIGLINKDSADLSRMVDDILTAARLESDVLAFEYQAVALYEEAAAAIAPIQRSGADIRLEGNALVWADPVRTRQIIRNLVSNAIQHGGPAVEVYLETNQRNAVVTVSDNGTGVDSSITDRLFERFVNDGQESLLNGSIGLGLSIARSLARTMDGDVSYVRAGGWTNFVLTLPLLDTTDLWDNRPDPADATVGIPLSERVAVTPAPVAELAVFEP